VNRLVQALNVLTIVLLVVLALVCGYVLGAPI
jgi:hypothetical protein